MNLAFGEPEEFLKGTFLSVMASSNIAGYDFWDGMLRVLVNFLLLWYQPKAPQPKTTWG